jgi:hypothetical protein
MQRRISIKRNRYVDFPVLARHRPTGDPLAQKVLVVGTQYFAEDLEILLPGSPPPSG